MADKITFEDKEKVRDSVLPNKNKGTADDFNEIKAVVNSHADDIEGKQETLESGVNIKTLNGESLLGSEDITTPNTSLATENQPIPDATNREVTLGSGSTLKVGGVKHFEDGKSSRLALDSYISDGNLLPSHITERVTNTRVIEPRFNNGGTPKDVVYKSSLKLTTVERTNLEATYTVADASTTNYDTDLNDFFLWNGTESKSLTKNLGNSNLTLTGNREVDLNLKNLTFKSSSNPDNYFKIFRNGGVEMRGSGLDTGNPVFLIKGRVNNAEIFKVAHNGGVVIDSPIDMGQFNSTWNYGMRFKDGEIKFTNGSTWSDNEHIVFNMRNPNAPILSFLRLSQSQNSSRFIVRNSTAIEASYGSFKEQISLQGNTLIKGDTGLERVPYNLKVANSNNESSFLALNNKFIVNFANTTPIVDSNLINDSFSFHIDNGVLQGRYKNNLGVVSDLKFKADNLKNTSSATAPTVTELPNNNDIAIHKDTVTGTVYLAYNDGGTIKTTTLT